MKASEAVQLHTRQAGHWYKCTACGDRIPLPDRTFDAMHSQETVAAQCKCGHLNTFRYSEAQEETTKREVDRYFGVMDARVKLEAYWTKRVRG